MNSRSQNRFFDCVATQTGIVFIQIYKYFSSLRTSSRDFRDYQPYCMGDWVENRMKVMRSFQLQLTYLLEINSHSRNIFFLLSHGHDSCFVFCLGMKMIQSINSQTVCWFINKSIRANANFVSLYPFWQLLAFASSILHVVTDICYKNYRAENVR